MRPAPREHEASGTEGLGAGLARTRVRPGACSGGGAATGPRSACLIQRRVAKEPPQLPVRRHPRFDVTGAVGVSFRCASRS